MMDNGKYSLSSILFRFFPLSTLIVYSLFYSIEIFFRKIKTPGLLVCNEVNYYSEGILTPGFHGNSNFPKL